MAEFCLDCMNKMDGTHYTEADVVLDVDLCEGCGELRPCVVTFRGAVGVLGLVPDAPPRVPGRTLEASITGYFC